MKEDARVLALVRRLDLLCNKLAKLMRLCSCVNFVRRLQNYRRWDTRIFFAKSRCKSKLCDKFLENGFAQSSACGFAHNKNKYVEVIGPAIRVHSLSLTSNKNRCDCNLERAIEWLGKQHPKEVETQTVSGSGET